MSEPAAGRGPEPPEEPPPLLGTWGRLYALVLLGLAGWIVLFYFFGRVFR